MTLLSKSRKVLLGVGAIAAVAAGFATNHWATASDHADTVEKRRQTGSRFDGFTHFPRF